jgi:MFS family permease
VVNFAATFLAFYLVDKFGRKSLLVVGATLMVSVSTSV